MKGDDASGPQDSVDRPQTGSSVLKVVAKKPLGGHRVKREDRAKSRPMVSLDISVFNHGGFLQRAENKDSSDRRQGWRQLDNLRSALLSVC